MVHAALVAIFVDMENVGGQFIRSVAEFGASQGRVCHLAVYGDWRRGYGQFWDATLDVGGVPTQILRTGGKNSADIAIVVDVMEFLSLTPAVQVYVLATGDSDFVPLAQKLRSRGKVVIGVAPKGRSVADTLVAACDRFERLQLDKAASDKAGGTRSSADKESTEADSAVATNLAPDPDNSPQDGLAEGPQTKDGGAADRQPSRANNAAADGQSGTQPAYPTPTIEQVRALLTEMLGQRSAMTTGAIGNLLQQAMPGFRHRALGHRTLSDLLRAQSDLLDVIPTAHELRITLLPGVRPPEGENPEPYLPCPLTDQADNAVPAEAAPESARVTDLDTPEQQFEELEEFFTSLPTDQAAANTALSPTTDLAAAARCRAADDAPEPASVLWPALLRHLGGIDLMAHPEARLHLAAAALLELGADPRGETTRQLAMNAGIPLPARRAMWLSDCAGALAQLGGENAVLDRLEQLDGPAKKAILLALPGVGPATAEAILAALEPAIQRAPTQNLLLF